MGRTLRLAVLFDRIYSEHHREMLERWIVAISIAAFLVHLAAILIARNLAHPPHFLASAGRNYLSAIYTPFSFILFYEVLVLIWSIPQSITRSVAAQYEIVSLIFIRGFFKDIASMNLADLDLADLRQPLRDMMPAFLDVASGLFMYFLVTVFRRAARRHFAAPPPEPDPALKRFVERKKITALALTVVFVWLAVSSLWQYEFEIFHTASAVGQSRAAFYSGVFTAMIFTDVLILLLSLLVSDRYESVFRSAAFVISAILIRFSLTAVHPFGAIFGIVGMIFGIITMLIYNYNARLRESR
jgi:hypothetical protein